MSWIDRLREAAYTSPSGARLTFTYEDVSRGVEKLTTAYDFPDGEGTFVQDLGRTGRRYPLRVIFWGADYDQAAADFEAALLERGVGTLEHPAYGKVQVVPFGAIERVDALKNRANQAVIAVEFWETTGAIYPTDQGAPADEAIAQVDDFNAAAAGQYEEEIETETSVERATLRDQIDAAVKQVRSGLQAVAETTDRVAREFQAVFDSITTGIDVLIGDPLTLAFQVATHAQIPARAAALIADKIDAYKNLAESIIEQPFPIPSFDNIPANEFRTRDLLATSVLSGAAAASVISLESVSTDEIVTGYRSQREAIAAADELAALFTEITDWREAGFTALELADTGETYAALQRLVGTTLGALVSIAFQLPQERTVTLARARNLVELVAQFYGETADARLNEFIEINELSGDEIIEIPAGRSVTYYV